MFVFFVLLLHSHVSLPIIFVVTIHSRQDLLPKIAFFKGTLCFCLPPIWICFRFEKRSIICKMFRPFLNCSFLFFNFCFFHSTLSRLENSSCCFAFHSDFTWFRFRFPSLKKRQKKFIILKYSFFRKKWIPDVSGEEQWVSSWKWVENDWISYFFEVSIFNILTSTMMKPPSTYVT